MNDMKKKLDFKVLASMGVVVFSACGSDSDLFNPEKAAAKDVYKRQGVGCV